MIVTSETNDSLSPQAEPSVTEPVSAPRRRVLISAFVFSPVRGSEPGIGWNIGAALAAHHDVTILCCPRLRDEDYRREIEGYLKRHGPIPGLEIRYVEAPLLSRWFQKPLISFSTPFYFVGYAAWQRAAFAQARQLHQQRPFDLAHQLTITGFREPGYLWKLPIPFVWGPVAGASDIPWSYFSILGWRDRLFYGLKNLLNAAHKRFKIRARRAARAADWIFVNAQDNYALITRRWGFDSRIMLDTGAPPLTGSVRQYDSSRPLRLVWSGLHVGRKALPLLLMALGRLIREPNPPAFELKILGGGPQTPAWKTLAAKLGLTPYITWTGQIPRDRAIEQMRDADVFVFTSVQEGTSSVVMEAMSLGLPVICHDACGMGVAVDESCGIKVSMRGVVGSVRGFADAIRALCRKPSRIAELSSGAIARARMLSWDHKVREIASTYELVLSERATYPSSAAVAHPTL
jgi:glycosyltransferase involved in cell wall biosynthesis